MDIITPRQPSRLESEPGQQVPVPTEPVSDDAEFEPTIVRGRE
ncbi:hypothetical protein [Amycolatopsis acidiphila]|nr:hypothetical protein [Amycolatopsis acidiphila]